VALQLIAVALVAAGSYLVWQAYDQDKLIDQERARYQQELEQYSRNNIHYNPHDIADWILARQNPQGYFVQSPDMMFEPSQLNTHTLRATRYAVGTLRELGELDRIDRLAVIDWVIGNYIPDLDQFGQWPDLSVYNNGPYAAFRTLEGESYGVRPTMDAIIILESLNALGDERIDLPSIKRFILAHQNEDGGFWDEHYPKHGKQSCLKCTSFALRALGRIQGKMGLDFDQDFKNKVSGYVQSCKDENKGGYASMPGKAATESYDTFHAFITLWWLQSGTDDRRREYVDANLQVDDLTRHLHETYYLPRENAYSRYAQKEKQQPSLKSSHLVTWLITRMQRPMGGQVDEFVKYILSNEGKAGDFGGDIYSTYSATGIFKKLRVASEALPVPVRPAILGREQHGYIPALLLLIFALLLFALAYALKKSALQADYESLAQRAMHDGLTGVFNRKKFEEIAELVTAKAQRYSTPLSLIMLDVDHFKEINDTYGHTAGDRVLKELAELVESNLRRADSFARWGGEEFIILVPENGLQEAANLAEKLRKVIESTDFRYVGSLTCSFGVAQMNGSESLSQVTERADEALYTAKDEGRNCVRTSR
jgi:diguanylate cyclase (GGDEF)-like protein